MRWLLLSPFAEAIVQLGIRIRQAQLKALGF
jgi:hypothetical protein